MANLNLKLEGPEGAKLKRSVEAFALQQGVTVEDVFLPTLRAIAQQVGLDANDDETDQEAALAKAARKGSKAKAEREARAVEAARIQAESAQRQADAEKAAEAANTKLPTTEN